MITKKLPIQGGAYKNVDEISLTKNSPALIDGYPNEAGSTVKRPGLSLWVDLNQPQMPLDGLYWWDKQKCVIAVCNKRVYRINDPVTKALIDITGTEFEQAGLTRIDDSGTSIYMANGKRIVSYDQTVLISTPEMAGSGNDDFTVSGSPTVAGSFRVQIDGADAYATASVVRSVSTPNDGDSVTIGTITYVFRVTPTVAYDVKVVTAQAGDTMDNLILAINSLGTPGVNYAPGTLAHPIFIAGVQDENLRKFTLTAILKGTVNNGIVLSAGSEYTVTSPSAGGVDNTFKWTDDGGVTWDGSLVAITTADQLLGSGVSIKFDAKAGHNLGDYWDFYTTQESTYLLPNRNAPDEVTHVAVHDSYLLCNEVNSPRFHYSEVGNPPIFNALNFASAESNPDDILAIHVAWREVALFGSKSIEPYYNDGSTPFVRLEGGHTERGISAKYSIQFIDNTYIFLDHMRRFSKMQGRTPVPISTPYDKVIQSLSRVDNAYSDAIEVNGRTFYVCTFPTDNLTVAFDWSANEWAQWSWWNQELVETEYFLGRCHAYSPDWGLHLIGDRNTSKIYAMDAQYYSDAGDTIRTVRRTGHVDHGTTRKKMCKGIRVKVLRGAGDEAGSEPKMIVRWRNDNGLWGQEHEISLGQQGDNIFYGKLGHGRSLGIYRSRQWEFIHTDVSSFILADAEEDFEVLQT